MGRGWIIVSGRIREGVMHEVATEIKCGKIPSLPVMLVSEMWTSER